MISGKQKVRFVDQLNLGAFGIPAPDIVIYSGSIDIINNVNNYILTATGQSGSIQGESELWFDGYNLGLSTITPLARFEIYNTSSLDTLLIRNSSNQGIKVDQYGTFQLLNYATLPTPQTGSFVMSGSEYFVGVP